MATVSVKYECPNAGVKTETDNGEVSVDVNQKPYFEVYECPECGESHYIDI